MFFFVCLNENCHTLPQLLPTQLRPSPPSPRSPCLPFTTCYVSLCHGHAHFGTVNASAFEILRLLWFFACLLAVPLQLPACPLSPTFSPLSFSPSLSHDFYLSSINIATCHLCHFSLCLVLFHLAFFLFLFFFYIFSRDLFFALVFLFFRVYAPLSFWFSWHPQCVSLFISFVRSPSLSRCPLPLCPLSAVPL